MPNQQAIRKVPDFEQTEEPDEVMQILADIKAQNHTMLTQFDALESNVTKRAQAAGAMTGAFTGGIGGAVVTIGIEFIKAKFGG